MLAGRYLQFLQALLAEAPWLPALIFLPLAVAAGFGGYLLLQAGVRYNVKKCNRGGKLRYWLQRVTAVAVLLFVGLHVWSLSRLSSAGRGGVAAGRLPGERDGLSSRLARRRGEPAALGRRGGRAGRHLGRRVSRQ